LSAGGTDDDYYMSIETVYPDGKTDEGGFGGPALTTGGLLNSYTGISSRGLRRVLARGDSRVHLLRLYLADGSHVDVPAVAEESALGLVLFATLLPPGPAMETLVVLDADDRELDSIRLRAAPP
jgi:hypothetical protein